MPFNFQNLDAKTRQCMMNEIEAAGLQNNLYFSKRFTSEGSTHWPALLLEAARNFDEHWLAYQLEVRKLMEGFEGSSTPSGGYTIKHVPHTAAETMADGQFNRYYILGLCCRAVGEGKAQVFIYRAKPVREPRPESEALLENSVAPADLIDQIRPLKQSLGHALLKPNSGLSVYLKT